MKVSIHRKLNLCVNKCLLGETLREVFDETRIPNENFGVAAYNL